MSADIDDLKSGVANANHWQFVRVLHMLDSILIAHARGGTLTVCADLSREQRNEIGRELAVMKLEVDRIYTEFELPRYDGPEDFLRDVEAEA